MAETPNRNRTVKGHAIRLILLNNLLLMVLIPTMPGALEVSFIRLRVILTVILDMFMSPIMGDDVNARSGAGILGTPMIV
jgi:hypothetical protein